MIVAVLIGIFFYRAAKTKELNPILWSFLGAGSFLGAQVIAGFFLGMFNSSLVNDDGMLIIIGLVSGIIGTAIVGIIFSLQGKKLKSSDDRILDTEAKSDRDSAFESRNKIHDEI